MSAQLEHAIAAVREIHAPTEAVMYPTQTIVKVCTGCGTDDGNWSRWPCATVRAIDAALASPNTREENDRG